MAPKKILKKKKRWKGLAEQIETVSVDRVQSHPKNPRIHDERNLQTIMGSLDEFEQLAPLVVWGPQNYVIVGNGRLEASKRLGKKEIDIVRADHLSEEQALAYMVADNKTTDLSKFDFEAVADIFKGLEKKDFDLSKTGFADFETEPLLEGSWTPPDIEDMPEPVENGANVLSFTEEQMQAINKAIGVLKGYEGFEDTSIVDGLVCICKEYEG